VLELSDADGSSGGAFAGSAEAVPVTTSSTTVDLTLGELLSSDHVIVVLASGDGPQIAACGEVGGRIVDGSLVVGLRPFEGSGSAGIAMLREDGGATTITLHLMSLEPATDPLTAAGGATATVRLVGESDGEWLFEPAKLEIAAGTTVTWINQTVVAHTVSGSDISFEDSGYFEPGETFSVRFDEPGVFSYICDPHNWMSGLVIVT
jgi:plastocyanin